MLKNNTCFFWVSAVVLPGVFFFVFDRWVLLGLLVFVVSFAWRGCAGVRGGLFVSRVLWFFSGWAASGSSEQAPFGAAQGVVMEQGLVLT